MAAPKRALNHWHWPTRDRVICLDAYHLELIRHAEDRYVWAACSPTSTDAQGLPRIAYLVKGRPGRWAGGDEYSGIAERVCYLLARRLHLPSQIVWVVGHEGQAGTCYRLGQSSGSGRHHRNAAGHRFEHRNAKPLMS